MTWGQVDLDLNGYMKVNKIVTEKIDLLEGQALISSWLPGRGVHLTGDGPGSEVRPAYGAKLWWPRQPGQGV